MSECDAIAAIASEALAQPIDSVVVNVAGVSFMDPTGLGSLIRALREAARRDVAFVVEDVPLTILQLLNLVGLTEWLALADDTRQPPPSIA